MAITLNGGTGVITGVAVGGLPDGIVDAGTLATNSVDSDELINGAIDAGHLASGVGGKVLQIVSNLSGASQTGTTVMNVDNTIPQITEGDEYYTLAITPASTSNTLEITCQFQIENNGGARLLTGALFNTDSHSTNALASASDYAPTGGRMHRLVFTHVMTAPSASSTTFRLRGRAETSGTTVINSHNASLFFNGTMRSGIIIKEYSA